MHRQTHSHTRTRLSSQSHLLQRRLQLRWTAIYSLHRYSLTPRYFEEARNVLSILNLPDEFRFCCCCFFHLFRPQCVAHSAYSFVERLCAKVCKVVVIVDGKFSFILYRKMENKRQKYWFELEFSVLCAVKYWWSLRVAIASVLFVARRSTHQIYIQWYL